MTALTIMSGTVKKVHATLPSKKGHHMMKILVITGSPRKGGNSSILADSFIKGARESGHTVARFDAAFKTVHPCTGCNHCGMDGPCIFNDDFNFRSIEKKTAKMITAQASGHESLHVVDTSELYAEDVQLISKDGKIYYLPESKAE